MHKFLTFFTLFFLAFNLSAQPSNDDCSGLIDLGEAPICPFPDTFNNVDATQSVVFSSPLDNIPSCFTGGVVDRDVWFSFTVPADGSILDFTIELTGVGGPNGSILQPQLAVYRGDCLLDELQELDCVTSAPGETSLDLDLQGLTPGLPYFLRISDWSASGTPNWGDFVLCVKEFVPVYNMGDETSSTSCFGTLYDSGGPDGDYSNNENLTFTICPDDFHQCIFINVNSFDLENDFDFLNFYAGPNISAPSITDLTGSGSNVEIQVHSSCVTIQLDSDFSVSDQGFELTWACSPDTCTIPPPITCDNAVSIPTLPYSNSDLTTCGAADNYDTSPCNNDAWMGSEDYIFTYESPGDECIAVSITGSDAATGVGIFNGCPNTASQCIARAGGGAGQTDPMINAAYLAEPGVYYIVVDNANACTPFNIEVQQVSCPVIFPSAALCEDALSLNGCGDLPAIISVAPGEGDENFIVDGVNDGCWAGFPPNFTFFMFQAQNDGEFGFILEAADPNESSDIDFQVWGPINNAADLCEYALTHQPIRSSYAAGADPTGLVNIHPATGLPVTDTCELAGGDDFVKKVAVQTGEFYLVLINDWGNQIVSGAVSIDFGGTTSGVLNAMPVDFAVSPDTVVCPGEAVQLFASGGEVYQWLPEQGLSCDDCPNPVANISASTTYSVIINTVCVADTIDVNVGLLEVNAGPDLTTCIGEQVQLNAGASFASVTYQWSDPAGFLSCTNCPNPIVTASTAGTYTFEVTATGPTCSFSDEMTLTVLPNQAPVYSISDNQSICLGETVQLGGPSTPGVTYNWTSQPAGFISNEANPEVTPAVSTTYFLEISNSDCPLPSFDSVAVVVSALPVIDVADDTLVCQEEPVLLGFTQAEPGVTYSWTPATDLSNPNVANPVALPTQTSEYTLTATRNGCSVEASVKLEVTEISIDIAAPDTIPICKGVSVPMMATALPAGSVVSWAPNDGSLNTTTGDSVIATPQVATSYIATVAVSGCVKMDTVYVGVDSLPYNLTILPIDTQICQGELVLLTSQTYEPADFSEITFQWLPPNGQLTPDSLFNMVVQPGETTTYQRIATNGFCTDTISATVNVVPVNSITITPADPVICGGASVQLTATALLPVEFTWEPATGLSCSECPDPVASPAVTTEYTVSGEYEGCPVSGGVTVEVLAVPFIVAPTGVLCPGNSTALNFAPNPAWTYSWTSPDDAGFASNEPAPVVSPNQTTNYEVTVSNGNCPPESFTLTVFVAQNPTLTVSNDTTVCGSNGVTLFADAGLPGDYTWEPGNATGTSFTPSLLEGVNTFTINYSNECGDNLTETIIVEVFPGIEISELTYDSDSTVVYQGTPITLGVVTDPAAATFSWSTGSTADTAQVTPLTLPGVTYSVTVTDDLGCSDSETISFEVLESQYDIPNVFSPNNDGINDIFLVIITGENIEVRSLEVWNRWGQKVHGETNSNTGWDGMQIGKPAGSDVYVYRAVISLPGGREVVKSGDVTLLR